MKGRITKEAFIATVTITTEEYNRLRDLERQYHEFLDQPDAIVITEAHFGWSSYGSTARIINPDEAMKKVVSEAKKAEEKLATIRDTKVPMFNLPGTKVKNLR